MSGYTIGTVIHCFLHQEIYEIVHRERQNPSHYASDAFVLVLISHGDTGVIFGSDEITVRLETVFNEFDGANCIPLKGKPKIIVIQACQGGESSYTIGPFY